MNIITIVIPVFNRADKVCATLQSLLGQSVQDFDVILVDNASTDGTRDVLLRWAAERAKVTVLTEPRRGAAAARQCGLDAVNTPWTMFFDSDDTLEPDAIARILGAIEAHPQAQMIGWNIEMNYGKRRKMVRFVPSQYRSLFNGTMGTLRYCARTELFRRVGGWNPAVGLWDDIELGARLLAAHPVSFFIGGAPLVKVYVGNDSITQKENSPSMLAEAAPALDSIACTLGLRRAWWTDLKRAINAAAAGLPCPPARSHRALVWAAYIYTRLGGRGAARLLQPFAG